MNDVAHEPFERQRGSGVAIAAKQLGALAEETRLTIMLLLHAGGPQSVSELSAVANKAFASVSHHLQILVGAGLVECAKVARENIYRVTPEVRHEPAEPGYLGGFVIEGFTMLIRATESEPEPEPDPEPEPPKPKPRKRRK